MSLHEQAEQDLEGFWAEQAERLRWMKPWDQVLGGSLPFAKWFVGGQLNVSDNCLDRHVDEGGGDKVAYHWEGEPGDTRAITYEQLRDDVARFANSAQVHRRAAGRPGQHLHGHGAELPVAMLACARLGAAHSVVFGGFSADALRDRINDAEAKVLITQDEGWQAGKVVPLKQNADDAVADTPSIEGVVVLRRTGNDVPWTEDRDVWWHDLVEGSPRTARPRRWTPRTCLPALHLGDPGQAQGDHAPPVEVPDRGGDHLQAGVRPASRHRRVLVRGRHRLGDRPLLHRLRPADQPRHQHPVRGAPNFPDKDRWWRSSRSTRSILYTAPTAIRTFAKWGTDWPKHDCPACGCSAASASRSSPEAWVWYQTNIGGGRCPVVDTWWQTKDGDDHDHALPGAIDTKPGSATFPFRGWTPTSSTTTATRSGSRAADTWCSEAVAGDAPRDLRRPEQYKDTYWSRFEGRYFASDGAKRDDDGYFWLLGRVTTTRDEHLGPPDLHHRGGIWPWSTTRTSPRAASSARSTKTTGQQIVAFVTLKGAVEATDDTTEVLREHVARKIQEAGQADHHHLHPRPADALQQVAAACSRTWPRSGSSAT